MLETLARTSLNSCVKSYRNLCWLDERIVNTTQTLMQRNAFGLWIESTACSGVNWGYNGD